MSQLQPIPITPPPGVILTESQLVVTGRFIASDQVRWVRGLPQKNGGFVQAVATPTDGTPRIAHAWRDNQADNFIAVGTYKKLYVYDSGFIQNDVTPFRATGTLGTNPFTTVNGSNVVTVNQAAHGTNPGDIVIFSGATTFNNVTMNGTFVVSTIVDASNYTVTAATTANANGAGGGSAVTFSYEIPIGVENPAYGLGYGVGGYGIGTYGSPHSNSTIYIEPRVWSLDHFGKFLIATYNGGTVYQFDPTQVQPWPRALKVDPSAPTDCRALFVTPERFVFVLRENMVVGWCSQGDFTTWTPASSNTANFRTLTEGTKLVGGRVLGPFNSMVWSDGAAYLFSYTGGTVIYNSQLAGRDCGLIAPNAAVTVSGIAYWMGTDNFFLFDGTVRPIDAVEDIRRFVYDNLDQTYSYQCTATYIPKFNEVEFAYTVLGQQNPTMCVVYSIDQKCWWPLVEARHAGTHFTQGDTRPYIPHTDGYLYQHENTYDHNNVPVQWRMTLAAYPLSNGAISYDVQGIIFDFFQASGNISVTANGYDYITEGIIDTDTETWTVGTEITDIRISGRYVGLTISGSDLSQYWRFGKPVAMVRPTGARL